MKKEKTLAQKRQLLKLSYRQVAKATGISYGSIRNAELGLHELGYRKMQILTKYYDEKLTTKEV